MSLAPPPTPEKPEYLQILPHVPLGTKWALAENHWTEMMFSQLSKWLCQFLCSPAMRRYSHCSIFFASFPMARPFAYFAHLVKIKWHLSLGSVIICPMAEKVVDLATSMLVSHASSSVKCLGLSPFFFFFFSFRRIVCLSFSYWYLGTEKKILDSKSLLCVWQISSSDMWWVSLLMNRSF